MGIPRFYRWLKGRYPMIRFDLTDGNKQIPNFDNFYIDFNALIYQCIRQSGCFLKNKIKPLTFEQITQRVIEYLLELIKVINPKKLLYIGLDGVAPRAKINQSRDRRFKSGIEDIDFFESLIAKLDIKTEQYFKANSISPGTQFLFDLCQKLKDKVLDLVNNEWKGITVIYSDCCVPGEGEHKIMEYLRYGKKNELFNANTTHCVYSPDADVILLTLALNIEYICIIKEDTTTLPSSSWAATSTYRKNTGPAFELVMINIVRQYFEKQFEQVLQKVKNCNIQKIINDFVLLMAFVGNDFLPVEFCFVLKDNHMDALFKSYKNYLLEHQSYINNDGVIDWTNVSKLLSIAIRFEANLIQEMKVHSKSRGSAQAPKGQMFDDPHHKDQAQNSEIQKFQVEDNKITKGKEYYYQSRFNIQQTKGNPKFYNIIKKYIEGLQFYCQYYYKGLPSWTWSYTYHYTPLLCDVYQYITTHQVNVSLEQGEPFDPFLALMFMFPQQNFDLLPKKIAEALQDPNCVLKAPIDYFPKKFALDKFQTLKYNKHAIIQFLPENSVRKVYQSIPKDSYTKNELQRNSRNKKVIFFEEKDQVVGCQIQISQKFKDQLRRILRPKYDGKQKESNQRRFPTLSIFGQSKRLNEKGSINMEYKYKYNGNPSQLVYFNGFLGYITNFQKATPEIRENIQPQYQKIGLSGQCETYYVIKRGQYVREAKRFHIHSTKKVVLVPDYALFKVPNYEYIHKTLTFQPKELYKPKETVIILTSKYFGCVGIIQQLYDQNAIVRITGNPLKSQQKIQELEQTFYSFEYALNHLELNRETLLCIISQIIVFPKMDRKSFNERLPTSINFGLNFIDFKAMKIVPRFVRCNFDLENSSNPQSIFDSLQLSQSGVKLIQQFVSTFGWLVQAIQGYRFNKNSIPKVQFKAITLFDDKQVNLRVYRQFIKLYEFDHKGAFQSIYSKIADPNTPKFHTEKKSSLQTVSFAYHEIFSRNQAFIAPPAYKNEPEYHNIGSRVIYLKSLEVGYVVGIDDNWIHVLLGKQKRRAKLMFTELYNQDWQIYLSKQGQKCWNYQVSYFSPSYWKKAITKS